MRAVNKEEHVEWHSDPPPAEENLVLTAEG